MNQAKKTTSLQILPYKAMMIPLRLIGICLVIIILLSLLPLAVPYVKNALSFQYIRTALGIEKAMSSFVKNIIPTKIVGKDLTRWIIIIIAFLLYRTIYGLRDSLRTKIVNLKVMRDYEDFKTEKNLTDDADVLAPLRDKIKDLQTANKKDREELLKVFAETKKKLDAMGRDLAFLSIDIVNSTGLKEGEEKASIEYDFKEYKNFVDNKLKSNGSIKSTWTPDGVLSCFETVDESVKAARDVLMGLEDFNKHVKTMRHDFRIRCGINAGYVYFDETLPLEEICDRVIDVAAHMQKHASPNSICIAKPAVEPLKERTGFIPISKIVDGYEVYVWDRRKVPRE